MGGTLGIAGDEQGQYLTSNLKNRIFLNEKRKIRQNYGLFPSFPSILSLYVCRQITIFGQSKSSCHYKSLFPSVGKPVRLILSIRVEQVKNLEEALEMIEVEKWTMVKMGTCNTLKQVEELLMENTGYQPAEPSSQET